jgi:Protein of unknown function (DUF2809)
VPTPARSLRRTTYAALAAATVVLGLLSRRVPGLPSGIGDALYATLIFWLIRFVSPGAARLHAGAAAIGLCFAIEVSQLYHAPWIDAVRDTRLGGLVLGHGFLASDLAWYVVGVLLGAVIERRLV